MKSKRVSERLREKYSELEALFHKYQVQEVRIFGSVACNKDHDKSDIDFLINLAEESTLLTLGQLIYEIDTILDVPLDVLTYSGLNESVREHFIQNSISFETINNLSKDTRIIDDISDMDKVYLNLKSILWLIERMKNQSFNILKKDLEKNPMLQDAIVRNLQLLSQVISQIPKNTLFEMDSCYATQIKAWLPLKEALFMNVDISLLFKTLDSDLDLLRKLTLELLEHNA